MYDRSDRQGRPVTGPGGAEAADAAEAEDGGWATLAPLLVLVAAMWTVEIIDTTLLDDQLQGRGIGPRRIAALDGVLWHPFLHSGFRHLSSNTVPLVVMGWLVALRGRDVWLAVTAGSAVIGGLLVWLFAGGVNHIGASGIVFGYFGALMGAAWRSRRPATLAPALVAIFLYGTILAGLLPLVGISWEGHLAGLIVGTVISLRMTPPPSAPPEDGDILYPWEVDEPWRVDRADGDDDEATGPSR